MPGRPQTPEQLRRCALAVAERLREEEGLSASEATGRAFAICTSSLQRYGYLKAGTHKPTAKGRKRSQAKATDDEALLKSLRYQRLLERGRMERAASRLDRERFARHRERMHGQVRGAANRALPSRELCGALQPLREAMELVFSCETAYGTCKAYNPAAAHCFMASALLQDLYGGQIVYGEVGMVPHYWVKIGRRYVDLTGDQFGRPPVQCATQSPYKVMQIFQRTPHERDDNDPKVQHKYDLFKQRVAQTLRGMGQRGMADALGG
jgi:hypothetical protein